MSVKQLCPRCGKKVCRLKRHLYEGKKLCEAKYINASADEIMGDYDRYLTDYNNKQLASKYKCECGKIYKYRQSLFTHRKICNYTQTNQNSINNTTNNTINNINNTVNNINNTVNNISVDASDNREINIITLQVFGNEIMPDHKQFMNMVRNKILYGREEELFNEFFSLVHIDIPENRNVYLPNIKDGYIDVFSKSKKWESVPVYKFGQELLSNNKNNLYKMITSIMEKHKNNKDILRTHTAYRCFVDDDDEYFTVNDKTRMLNIKSILSKNKELLKESKKASQNATKINSIEINNRQNNNAIENDISNDIVEDTITDDDINKLIQKINNNEILEDDDTNLDSKLVKILGDNYMNYVNNILIKDDMLNRIKNYKII